MATPETRPATLTASWAESGTVADIGDVSTGWPSGKPGRGRFNKVLNWLMMGVRHILAWGIPPYDASDTYPPGAHVSYAGTVYQQVNGSNVIGVTPGTDTSKWLRWGHTDADVDGRIDSKLGTLSAAAPGGTISSSNESSYTAYGNVVRLPGSTIKLVLFRLTFSPSDSFLTTVTLSGACAFATGADNVVVSSATALASTSNVHAVVTGAQTVDIAVDFPAGTEVVLEVMVQGH